MNILMYGNVYYWEILSKQRSFLANGNNIEKDLLLVEKMNILF